MTEIESYLTLLTGTHPSIQSIWLIGSRANGASNVNSDWDLIVFATEDILQNLQNCRSIHVKEIDLLVVYNCKGDFKKPWAEQDGNFKTGNLKDWGWQEQSETKATYRQQWRKKGPTTSDGFTELDYCDERLIAQKVWPQRTC